MSFSLTFTLARSLPSFKSPPGPPPTLFSILYVTCFPIGTAGGREQEGQHHCLSIFFGVVFVVLLTVVVKGACSPIMAGNVLIRDLDNNTTRRRPSTNTASTPSPPIRRAGRGRQAPEQRFSSHTQTRQNIRRRRQRYCFCCSARVCMCVCIPFRSSVKVVRA